MRFIMISILTKLLLNLQVLAMPHVSCPISAVSTTSLSCPGHFTSCLNHFDLKYHGKPANTHGTQSSAGLSCLCFVVVIIIGCLFVFYY